MQAHPQSDYEVRTMAAQELAFAIELAAREGWNPGLADAEAFYSADPQGFFVGILDGEPIGCISAVSYEGQFGFIGLYIVAPEFRGKGYGIQLWRHAMRYLAGHNIGLDGVVEQQANYRKSGFTLAHRNIRYSGVAVRSGATPTGLLPAAQVPFAQLAAYDRGLFPAARKAFLRAWLAIPDATALAVPRTGGLEGYGVIRPCREGYKLAPLFADTPDVAEALFAGLTATLTEGTPFFLDLPETNPASLALAHRHGMTPVFETARMYTGAAPPLPDERIFGITTFELG